MKAYFVNTQIVMGEANEWQTIEKNANTNTYLPSWANLTEGVSIASIGNTVYYNIPSNAKRIRVSGNVVNYSGGDIAVLSFSNRSDRSLSGIINDQSVCLKSIGTSNTNVLHNQVLSTIPDGALQLVLGCPTNVTNIVVEWSWKD